jgi:hypothetical protein
MLEKGIQWEIPDPYVSEDELNFKLSSGIGSQSSSSIET